MVARDALRAFEQGVLGGSTDERPVGGDTGNTGEITCWQTHSTFVREMLHALTCVDLLGVCDGVRGRHAVACERCFWCRRAPSSTVGQ